MAFFFLQVLVLYSICVCIIDVGPFSQSIKHSEHVFAGRVKDIVTRVSYSMSIVKLLIIEIRS